MHKTRLFRNGNSQAVRIPAEIAYPESDAELEIRREGDELRIRPVRRSLADALRKLIPVPDFMEGGRGEQTQVDRESL